MDELPRFRQCMGTAFIYANFRVVALAATLQHRGMKASRELIKCGSRNAALQPLKSEPEPAENMSLLDGHF